MINLNLSDLLIIGRWLDCPNWGVAKRLRDFPGKQNITK
jgi:hypothetical protein